MVRRTSQNERRSHLAQAPQSATTSDAERVPFSDSDFPHERDQIVRTKCITIGDTSLPQITSDWTPNSALIDSDIDTDSYGVSDPSGRARGRLKRAHRGRSRHGYLL